METEAHREEILARVCSMQSFVRHMSHPKLQNWFAWNKVSYQQQGEFWGAKLVFESQLEDEDPDPEREKFSIKPSTDPRAELQKILKSGGGISLAFHLMQDGLQQHIKIQYIAEKASWCFKNRQWVWRPPPLRHRYNLNPQTKSIGTMYAV